MSTVNTNFRCCVSLSVSYIRTCTLDMFCWYQSSPVHTPHRHTPGGHHSRRVTRESSSAHRSAGGGDGNDGHDHRTAAAAAEETNRETSNGAATGNEHHGSPKGHPRESAVGGAFLTLEEDRIAEPLNGGGHRSTRRGRLATTPFNPPIAVLGRPNHAIFPGLEDTHFGEGVEEGGAKVACEVLRGHFEKKEVLKARVNFLLYQVRPLSRRNLGGRNAGAPDIEQSLFLAASTVLGSHTHPWT